MRTRKRWPFVRLLPPLLSLQLAITGAMCLCAPQIHAQNISDAKRQFAMGVQHFASGEYHRALSLFRESYKEYPRPSTLFNIAMCNKALMQNLEAIANFQSFLDEPKDYTDLQMRQDASDAIDALLLLVGVIEFDGLADGSKISINGNPAGIAPLEHQVFLNPGTYQLKVELKNHKALISELTVFAGAKNKVWAKLEPRATDTSAANINAANINAANINAASSEAPLPKPLIKTTTTENSPIEEPSSTKKSVLYKSGIFVSSLGLTSVGLGIFFTVKYFLYRNDGVDALNNYRSTFEDKYKAEYYQAQSRMETSKHGLVASYIIGGILATTGVIILAIDKNKNTTKTQPKKASMTILGSGAVLSF